MTASPPSPEAFLEDLTALVSTESPTEDLPACRAALADLADLCARRTGRSATVVETAGRPHLLLPAATDRARVLLLGHVDTVWPLGTLDRWPLSIDGDRVTGPGVFDMKAGLVMGLMAMASLPTPARDTVALLVTTDEETGSATSQRLVEDSARAADAVLVLEPSAPGGALKTARKGVAMYRADVTGRAAHAGLEPERGVNALVQLAALVPDVVAIADPDAGTTVTPTVAAAGTTMNTVPAHATMRIDVRAASSSELERVHDALGSLHPTVPGATVTIDRLGIRPPLEPALSQELLTLHRRVTAALGQAHPGDVAVGGGSDGNFTAGIGVPTLDGLGAVGDGAHAEGEHVLLEPTLAATARLTALLAALVDSAAPA